MKLFILFLALSFALASDDYNDAVDQEGPADQDDPVDPEHPLDSENPEDQENPDKIITNGFAAHETTAPYIVSLSLHKYSNNNATLCGGSIIGISWVLTSAYCLDGHDYADVYYGSIWKWNGPNSYRVHSDDFHKHHLYPQTSGNDIGLIRIPEVYFTNRVGLVRLPTFSQMSDQYLNCWVRACGWGVQQSGREADSLHCMENTVMSNNECSQFYQKYLPNGVLCVRSQGSKSTCNGDFGGPLITIHNSVLVGVTSFVSGAGCTAGHPAGFTRVSAHLNWIRQKTGIVYY